MFYGLKRVLTLIWWLTWGSGVFWVRTKMRLQTETAEKLFSVCFCCVFVTVGCSWDIWKTFAKKTSFLFSLLKVFRDNQMEWTLTLHFSDCYFLASARFVDTFLTFKINRRALLLNGIISHWRRDSSLETSEDFFPIFYFKRRDTNFNLPQEYPDLHALHSFNAIFRFKPNSLLLANKQINSPYVFRHGSFSSRV